MKLTKKQKAKWLKALRSGEYSQTEGTLYDEASKGFCCLGVLQHCLSKGSVEYNEDDEPCATPSVAWYKKNGIAVDLAYPEASYPSDKDETMLMNMNDGTDTIKRRTFRGIAQWIERNVKTID